MSLRVLIVVLTGLLWGCPRAPLDTVCLNCSSAYDATTGPPSGDYTDLGPPRPLCETGTSWCADEMTLAVCVGGERVENTSCPIDSICSVDHCTACVPGHTLRCDSETSRLVCGADGREYQSVACPPEAHRCFDGACTETICEPGSTICHGDTLFACAADGLSEEMIERCRLECRIDHCVDPCDIDGKSYFGCEFWAVDLDQFAFPCETDSMCQNECIDGYCTENNARDHPFGVAITNVSTLPVEVTIEHGATPFRREIVVSPWATQEVELPSGDIDNSHLSQDAFRIHARGPIMVQQFNPGDNVGVFSNDASLLLPANSLGSRYRVMGWPSNNVGSLSNKSYVVVIAVEEKTSVQIKSPVAISSGLGVPFLAPHVAHTLHLELGDVLALATADQEHGQDLTGMEIDAEHSVAVFSGAECAEIPQGNRYCDHLEEQLLPLSTWGTEHVLGKFSRRGAEPDLWKILNGDQETTVHANPPLPGVHGMVLGPGATLEFETDRDLFIKTNSPVSIGQFMVGSAYPGPENNCSPGIDVSGCALPYESTCRSTERMGDPAFSINVPTRQFRRQYGFLVPAFYQRNHVNILFKQGTGITLDGESLATTGDHVTQIGSTSWLVIRQHTTAGPHRIEADAPIGLYVYGYDCSVSYALPGGLNLTRF